MFGNRRPAGLQGDGNSAVGHGMAHPFTRSYELAYDEQAHLRRAAIIASGLRAILPAGVVRWPHAAPTHIPAVFAMHPDQHPEPVPFMSNEEGDALVVSFAVNQDAPDDVLSVILSTCPAQMRRNSKRLAEF